MRTRAGVTLALVALLGLGGCDQAPVFTDDVAGRRVGFSDNGPSLGLTYLNCQGEAPPDIRVVQEHEGRELDWEIRLDYVSGSPLTNGVTEWDVNRQHGEARAVQDELPDERESSLEVTIEPEEGPPYVVSNLQISDLPEDGYLLATGEVEDDETFLPRDWETSNSDAERRRGCHLLTDSEE